MAADALPRGLGSPLAGILARAWFDGAALATLIGAYLPASRLWAAAGAAEGDLGRFAGEAGLPPLRGPRAAVARLALDSYGSAAVAAREATARWDEAFFGEARAAQPTLASLERARRLRNQRWMSRRLSFLPLLQGTRLSALRWDIPTPQAAEAAWGEILSDPASAYSPPPTRLRIQRSAALRDGPVNVTWVRFPSPAPWMGDTAMARVTEPEGQASLSVIVGDGLFAEAEYWGASTGQAARLARRGIRIVELTSPWHGFRMKTGRYGGEPFLATAPVGPLALLAAQVREAAALVRWCRSVDDAPVALTGTSMSSFVAQLVATYADRWPREARPDGVLLIVHHGRLSALMLDSRLSTGLGVHDAMARAGWNDGAVARWGAAGSPGARPGLAPERIVSVLGEADVVTPYGGGRDLADEWALPASNRFVLTGGHFSTALSLSLDRRPFERLRAVSQGRF